MKKTVKERIQANVQINLESGCWEWQRAKDRNGYGRLKVNGVGDRVHRIAYLEFVGEIPKGVYVIHKCGNKGCCCPEHLRLGNPKK